MFGFNHAEAIRAFKEGARLDPACVMCYWGIAIGYGPHVNAPTDSASSVAAYTALRKAVGLLSHASARERLRTRGGGLRTSAAGQSDRA